MEVRTVPHTRFVPRFNRDDLIWVLTVNGVGYILTGQMRDNYPGHRGFSILSREGRTAE